MDIKVDEYTSSTPVTVSLNSALGDAMDLMKKNGIRHLPVVDGKTIVGLVSERDLLANFGKPWSEHLRVKEIMQTDVLFAYENDSLGEVAFRLSKDKKGSAIILDSDDNLYGIFTTTDALNALVEILDYQGEVILNNKPESGTVRQPGS